MDCADPSMHDELSCDGVALQPLGGPFVVHVNGSVEEAGVLHQLDGVRSKKTKILRVLVAQPIAQPCCNRFQTDFV